MRVHLLLILFFVSTILALSARNKRATGVTTVKPSNIFTTEANNGNTTTDVTGNKCDEINCENNVFSRSLKMMTKLIKSLLTSVYNTLLMILKALNSTSDLMLRAMMQPFVAMLSITIKILEWMLQFL